MTSRFALILVLLADQVHLDKETEVVLFYSMVERITMLVVVGVLVL